MRLQSWIILLAILLCTFGMFAGGQRDARRGRALERRVEELRALARPAEARLSHGPESDDLRARLADLDRQLQELAPVSTAPPDQGLTGAALASDLTPYRAWVERARPALVRWLHEEPCATPPSGAVPGSEAWKPLRWRVDARLQRGERIATEIPRLLWLRNWGNLLAWTAFFEAQESVEDEPWELDAAGILASTFPLVLAFDDGSLIGTMARNGVEQQMLRAAKALLQHGSVPARALRSALEPELVRSGACRSGEVLEGELRAILAIYDRARAGEAHEPLGEEQDLTDAGFFLWFFAGVEEAFEFAGRGPLELHAALEGAAREDKATFARTSIGALLQLERHRSILALGRVALAIEEQRERTGALPERLELLAEAFPGGLPTDPLTGASFPYTVDGSHARLGPTACPEHGSDASRHLDWTAAVEQLLAWEF